MSMAIAIILTVLKVLGIILLSILAILLMVLSIILFVPVRYKGTMSYHDKLYANVQVSWLMRLISISLLYKDDELHHTIRIFKRLKDKEDEKDIKETKKKSRNAKKKKRQHGVSIPQEVVSESYHKEEHAGPTIESTASHDDIVSTVLTPEKHDEEYIVEHSEEHQEEVLEIVNESVKRQLTPLKNIKSISPIKPIKIKDIKEIKSIKEIKKIKQIKGLRGSKSKTENILDKVKKVYNHEERRYAYKKIKQLLKKLWKHIKPKRLKVNLTLGFEDPSQTGKILGAICVVKPFLDKESHIQVYGDFGQDIIDGDIKLKGRIYTVYLIYLAGVFYLDKRLMRFTKDTIKIFSS